MFVRCQCYRSCCCLRSVWNIARYQVRVITYCKLRIFFFFHFTFDDNLSCRVQKDRKQFFERLRRPIFLVSIQNIIVRGFFFFFKPTIVFNKQFYYLLNYDLPIPIIIIIIIIVFTLGCIKEFSLKKSQLNLEPNLYHISFVFQKTHRLNIDVMLALLNTVHLPSCMYLSDN